MAIFVLDAVDVPVGIPRFASTFSHSKDHGGGIDGGINLDSSGEVTGRVIEFVAHDLSLGKLDVGSREGLYFFGLEFTIRIVEAFRSVASRSGKILVGFVLPVRPAEKVFLSNIGDLVDLACTDIRVQTGSELAHEQGDSKSFSVISSLTHALLVESKAFFSAIRGRLTSFTDVSIELAAVSVSIQSVVCRANLTTWRLAEANSSHEIEDLVAKDLEANNIGEDDRLEDHDAVIVGSFVSLLVESCEQWLKERLIGSTLSKLIGDFKEIVK